MKGVANVAVVEMFEGNKVGSNDTGVLRRCGVFPAEGLTGGEGER